MDLLTDSFTPTNVAVAVALGGAAAYALSRPSDDEQTAPHNLRGPKSSSYLSGNFGDIFGGDMNVVDPMIDEYGLAMSVYGLANKKMLYIADPKALAHIATHSTDFRKPPLMTKNIMMLTGPGIFAAEGEMNRRQVSPTPAPCRATQS